MRLTNIDFLKGIGIILVVLGHAIRGVDASIDLPEVWQLVDGAIYSFHMPLFFFLSGFFLLSTLKRLSAQEFLVSRIRVIIVPMVIWTYVFLLFKFAAGKAANHPMSLSDVLIPPVPPVFHFWFIWALFLTHILCLVLFQFKVLQNRQGLLIVTGLFAVATILELLVIPSGIGVELFNAALRNMVYVLLGIVVGSAAIPNGFAFHFQWPIFIAAGFAFVGFEILYVPVRDGGWMRFALVLSALVFLLQLAAALNSLEKVRNSVPYRFLVSAGQASLAIYLMHTIFSAITRVLLLKLGIKDIPLHLLGGVIAGVLAPWLIYLFIKEKPKLRTLAGL